MPKNRKPRLFVGVALTGAVLVVTGCAGSGGKTASRDAAVRPDKPSVSSPAVGDAGLTGRTGATKVKAGVLRTAVLTDIPPSALAAYQRAANAMSTADATCHLGWPLLAAVGKVESNHGRSAKTAKGIVGPRLDGTKGTQAVPDSDLAALDGDKAWDHAVGPMQMLPATWSEVAVDGDGDGVRNPQDIDDAALAAAVYLCGGSEDLSQPAGARAALLNYNHDGGYAALVQSIASAYSRQEKASMVIDTGTVQAVNLTSINESSKLAAGEVARQRADQARKKAAAAKAAAAKAAAAKAAATKAAAKPAAPATPSTDSGWTPGRPVTAATPPTTRPPAEVKVQVPAVTGSLIDAALGTLSNAGLGTVSKALVFDPAGAGSVLGTDPVAGTVVAKGSSATLFVSLGPVPDQVGKTLLEARTKLVALGFDVVTTGAEATNDAVVSDQSPGKDSTRVARGATITLTLTAPTLAPTAAPTTTP